MEVRSHEDAGARPGPGGRVPRETLRRSSICHVALAVLLAVLPLRSASFSRPVQQDRPVEEGILAWFRLQGVNTHNSRMISLTLLHSLRTSGLLLDPVWLSGDMLRHDGDAEARPEGEGGDASLFSYVPQRLPLRVQSHDG